MIHPNTKLDFVSDSVGYGVFATSFIPKGTIVYVKDDMEIVVPKNDNIHNDKRYKKIIDTYSYRDEKGNYILSWDIAKYINHCCEPNSISTGYGFEIAIKDIQIGEQITDEYGLLNIEQPIPLNCVNCKCRKVVSPNDYKTHLPRWDKEAKEAIDLIKSVEQPLFDYIDDELSARLKNYLNGKEAYISLAHTILKDEVKE